MKKFTPSFFSHFQFITSAKIASLNLQFTEPVIRRCTWSICVCSFLFLGFTIAEETSLENNMPMATFTTQPCGSGNWTDNACWMGGSAPGSDILSNDVVNINHDIFYDTGADLKIFGDVFVNNAILTIEDGRSVLPQSGGLFEITNSSLLWENFQCGGSESGNFKNEGGTFNSTNSNIDVNQNCQADGGDRTIVNTCWRCGENFQNANSTDVMENSCIEVGVHESGNFQIESGSSSMHVIGILEVLHGNYNDPSCESGSGSFQNSGTITGAAGADIYIEMPEDIQNSGAWAAPASSKWCAGGSDEQVPPGSAAEDCGFFEGRECIGCTSEPQDPGIQIEKTGSLDLGPDNIATPGDMITYTLTVTNTGNVTLTNVDLTDPLPGISIGPLSDVEGNGITTLDPGDVESAIATYAITQADIDAGVVNNTATTTGDCPDGTVDCAMDDNDHEEPIPASPGIQLEKTGSLALGADGIATPGDIITYTLTVTNTGNVTLTNVDLTDPLPGISVGTLSDDEGNGVTTLAPGDIETATATYAITQADIDAGVVNNTATTTGDCPDGTEDCVTDDDPHQEPIPASPGIQLDKTGSLNLGADGIATPGDIITYTFTITNTGNVTLTNVDLTDPLPGLTIGSITDAGGNGETTFAPGDIETATGTYAITQDDINTGSVTNTATTTGDCPDGTVDCVTDMDDHNEPVNNDPDINLVKTGSLDLGPDNEASPGDIITYTLEVTNTGGVTLTNVDLMDVLPNVTIGTLSDNAGNGETTLDPGDMEMAMATYAITQEDIDAGSVTNTATTTGDCPDGTANCVTDSDDHFEPIEQNPSLLVEKNAIDVEGDQTGDGPADEAGDVITYEIKVTNNGNVTLTGVIVNDPLTGTVNQTCGSGTLTPGASCTVIVTYTVTQDDLDNNGGGDGDIDNTACGDSNQTPPQYDDEEVPVDPNPSLMVEKEAIDVEGDNTGDGPADEAGEIITYNIIVTNTGNVTLTSVVVNDPLTNTVNAVCGTGTLGIDESCTVQVMYTVTQEDIDTDGGGDGDIDNTACGDSEETGEACDNAMVPVTRNPLIDLVKTGTLDLGANGTADPGDIINYTFEITNIGNTTLTNVVLTDSDPNVIIDCTGFSGTLAPDESFTCTGTYAITAEDIEAGQKENSALVTGDPPNLPPVQAPDTEITPIDILTCEVVEVAVASCNDSNDGSATVTVSGGTPDYTFTWDNGEDTQTAIALSAGPHTVMVTDANGATTSCSVEIGVCSGELSITAPVDLFCSCGAGINPNPAYAAVVSTCSSATVDVIGPTIDGPPDCPGTKYTYIYQVTDGCGNTATDSQVYTIENDPPEMNCPDNCIILSCQGDDAFAIIEAWLLTVTGDAACFGGVEISTDYDPENVGVCMTNGFTPVNFWGTDACGRESHCESAIIIVDDDAPVIIEGPDDMLVPCTAITDDIFQNWLDTQGGAIAYDDCWEDEITWTTDPPNPTVDCSQGPQAIVVDFIATDGCGNSTTVTGIFNTKILPINANVSGSIQREDNKPVADVQVGAYSNALSAPEMEMTSETGEFGFQDLPVEEELIIEPGKDDDTHNGLSTFDLLLLQRHILQVQLLDSPYKLIAADINRSGTISTLDLLLLRRIILHIDEAFNDNSSWRFIDADFIFPNPENPFESEFPEMYAFLGNETEIADFVAIKIGDLNLDANLIDFTQNDDRTGQELDFTVENRKLSANIAYEVELKAQNFNMINGFQFTLEVNPDLVNIIAIEPGVLPDFTAEKNSYTREENGLITFSWHSDAPVNISSDETVFRLFVHCQRTCTIDEALSMSSVLTRAEAYRADDVLIPVLNFEGQVEDIIVPKKLILYQNNPNPFIEDTNIGFYLPESGEVTFTFFDINRTEVLHIEEYFEKGFNAIDVSKSLLGRNGVIYYKVRTEREIAFKAMVILE